MKTDSLFYILFQTLPSLLFELIDQPENSGEGYRFASEEIKQTAFRIDGVLLPPDNQTDAPVYFVEVQFQPDAMLYRRLFSEAFLYIRQHPTVSNWQAVVIYPNASVEIPEPEPFWELLNSPRVHIVYLDELEAMSDLPLGLGILRLIIEPEISVPSAAKTLIERAQKTRLAAMDTAQLVELIETIVVYTFPNRSRREIAAMLDLIDMRETRVYREAHEEGLEEGREEGLEEGREEGLEEGIRVGAEREKALIMRLLVRKLGTIPERLGRSIHQLPLETLEVLGEALFGFNNLTDLSIWLEQHRVSEDVKASLNDSD